VTAHARLVLADCEMALGDVEAGTATEVWRTRWVGLVALLRVVGHVLNNVDAEVSREATEAIRSAWMRLHDSKPEPWIFWSFIEDERNNVLKLYQLAPRKNITLRPGAVGQPSGPTTHELFFTGGSYRGRPPLDVCRDAIAFWRAYVDEIDADIASRSTQG
jgi:hypothetical protein